MAILGGLGSRLGEAFGFGGKGEEQKRLEEELQRRASGDASTARLAGQQRENANLSRTLAASNTGAGNPALAQRQAADFLEGANARSRQQENIQASQEQLQAQQQLDALEQRQQQQEQQGLGNLLSTAGSVGGFLAGQGGDEGDSGQGGGPSLPGGQLMQGNGVGGIASAVTGGGGGDDGGLLGGALGGGGDGGGGLGTIGSLAGTAAGGPLGGAAGGALGNALTGGDGGGLGGLFGGGEPPSRQDDLALLGGVSPKREGAVSANTPGSGRSLADMQRGRAQAQADKDAMRSELGLGPEPMSEDEFLQGMMEGRF